ncbi:methyltransferase domain-containing protein [Colletotrichum lupini]|uniref:Methyltransferase domain-containing protein n=1 Tax=Colletotrichum lupini TaxID=145971 RepID=A0A9Q8T4J4_9PEZI|nr:methyltransferase domain-containing protein [Colletotrichum lupini]UQC89068.1 methyltransferase domain-containing protein [Colletotrichum lupini]
MQQNEDQPPIEADDSGIDDASSIGGVSTDESSASLRSSILDYRRENGRTYHRMSDGKYVFPNDEREQDRLDIVNHIWMLALDNAFCLCPKNDGTKAKRVLDIGTGTGTWALDYAETFPEATVLGVDLSPIQPGFVPPNCSFEVDDLEKEWTWTNPFDFILCRNMNASFSDWNNIIKQAYDHLEPGGYFEIQDSHWPLVADDDTMKGTAMDKWGDLLVEACTKIGRPVDKETVQLVGKMEEMGFEDVRRVPFKFPSTGWPKDKKLKELGDWNRSMLSGGLEGLTLALLTRYMDWSKEEALILCAQVRKELADTRIHAYWNGYVIYGRKPLKAGEEGNAN